MFSRRSSIGQILVKIPKSDREGKSCQNMKLKGGGNRNFVPGEFWPFNAFVILKTTFSKHQLMKISITYMYIQPEVDTKMIQQQW